MAGILDRALRDQARRDEVRAHLLREHKRPTPDRVDDWRMHWRTNPSGKIWLPDQLNIDIALSRAPELVGVLGFNELQQRPELRRTAPWREVPSLIGSPWRDEDECDLVKYLQEKGLLVRSTKIVGECVRAHARKHPFHPVRDWLTSLEWDREPRGEQLLEIVGARGAGPYPKAALQRFMIAAVARAMGPGCKADHMLVLVGKQGIFKSTFALRLGAPWAVEGSNASFGSKDSLAELDGVWIMEVGELSAMNKSELEAIKYHISKQSDHYRPAYGRNVIDRPRGCVFLGTTNEDRFLRDHTGNRRFWPIETDRIDLDLLDAHREQLWAEAVALWRAGEPWYLVGEEAEDARLVQERHRKVSEVEIAVNERLERLEKSRCPGLSPPRTTTREMFGAISNLREQDSATSLRSFEMEISQVIRRRRGWIDIGKKNNRPLFEYRPEEDLDP